FDSFFAPFFADRPRQVACIETGWRHFSPGWPNGFRGADLVWDWPRAFCRAVCWSRPGCLRRRPESPVKQLWLWPRFSWPARLDCWLPRLRSGSREGAGLKYQCGLKEQLGWCSRPGSRFGPLSPGDTTTEAKTVRSLGRQLQAVRRLTGHHDLNHSVELERGLLRQVPQ